MKKSIILSLILLLATSAFASTHNSTDTLTVSSPRTVSIISTDSLVTVRIEGAAGNDDYSYSMQMGQNAASTTFIEETSAFNFNLPFVKRNTVKKCKYPYLDSDFLDGGVCFGLGNALNAEPGLQINQRSSYEILVTNALTNSLHLNKHFSLNVGLGFGWRNYRLKGLSYFSIYNGYTTLEPYPDRADIDYSRIKLFSWMVPVTASYRLKLSKELCFDLGALLNFNTYGSTVTKYKLDGERYKTASKNINQTPVTVDVLFRFTIDGAGFYCKYSPMRILDTNYGPAFSALSYGVVFFF